MKTTLFRVERDHLIRRLITIPETKLRNVLAVKEKMNRKKPGYMTEDMMAKQKLREAKIVKAFYRMMGRLIQSSSTKLFTQTKSNTITITTESKQNEMHIKLMKRFGSIVANSIATNNVINVRFAQSMIKELYSLPLTTSDREELNIEEMKYNDIFNKDMLEAFKSGFSLIIPLDTIKTWIKPEEFNLLTKN